MLKLVDIFLIIFIVIISILVGFFPKILNRLKRCRSARTKQPKPSLDIELEELDSNEIEEEIRLTKFYMHSSSDNLNNDKTIINQNPSKTSKSVGKNNVNHRSKQTSTSVKPPNFFMNAISIVISFQTAITTLGMPVEFYYFGWKTFQYTLSFAFAALVIAIFFVPIIYKIKSKSIYEYLDDKFDGSRAVKNLTLILVVISQFSLSSLVLFSTCICVMHIISLSYAITIWPIAFSIATLSALLAILGLESIIWSNFIQYCIMVTCQICIILFGIKNYQYTSIPSNMTNLVDAFMSNLNLMFNATKKANRNEFITLDANFRNRYTIWNSLFGLLVGWITCYCLTQQNYMRIKAAPTVKSARVLMFTIIPFGFINLSLVILVGFVIFAYFYKCGDPFSGGLIKNQNQLVTKFLIQFFSEYNGLLGLFIGVLISSSIGALSNVLKALSVTLNVDIFRKLFKPEKSMKNSNNQVNTLVKQKQRASEKQLEHLYGQELLNINEKNLTKNHKQFLRKYKKSIGLTTRKVDIIIIFGSAIIMTVIVILLEQIPGSLVTIAFSIINSINGPVMFIYFCAKFNEYSIRKIKYAFNVGKRSTLNKFKLKSYDVVISCILSILFVQFLYAGQLFTFREYQKFYDSEKLPVTQISPNQSVELKNFCQYDQDMSHVREIYKYNHSTIGSVVTVTSTAVYKQDFSQSFRKESNNSSRKESLPGFMHNLYAISFNWYTFIGFFASFIVLFFLILIRLLLYVLVFCLCRIFSNFKNFFNI